jgi:hypothetical protein
MEQYLLTQEDIDRLNLTGVMAGEPATVEEMKLLGLPVGPSQQEPLPPTVPVEQQTTGSTAPITPATNAAAPVAAPATSPAVTPAMGGMDMTTAMSLLSQPVPQDPFENLSRSQRTMLGFAALKDAGMALQGKEGSAVKNVMADITERADMERKRQTALARQQMIGRLTGGAAGGQMNRQAIINAMAVGAIDGPTGTAMLAELERQTGVSQEIAGKEMMIGQIDALLFDPALGKALGIEGFLRTPFAELGLDTETARVKARIDQIKGGAFLQAFESLKGGGQITELEGQKAEAAQSRLNTAQSEEDFKNALMEYKFYIEQGIRRLNGEQIPPDTLYDQAASDPLGIR